MRTLLGGAAVLLPLLIGCADRWRDSGISIEQSQSLMSRETPSGLATAKPGDTITLAGKPLVRGVRETVDAKPVASDTLRGLTVNNAPLPLVTKDTYQEPKLRLISMQGDSTYTPSNRGATRPELRWRGPLVLWTRTDDPRPANPPPRENFSPMSKLGGVPAPLQDTIGLYFETREWFETYGRVAVVAGPYGSGNLNPQPAYNTRNVAMFTVSEATSEIVYFARDGAITTADQNWWCVVYRLGTAFGYALSPDAAAKEVGPADLKPWPAGQGRFTPVRLDALNEERDVSLFWYPVYKN